MKIPIFISCPSSLNSDQETSKKLILKELDKQGLEPRQLGKSDYPTESPLNEVLSIAKHCAGGIILGFEQLKVSTGIRKRGTNTETKLKKPIILPTEWNHLEAGILFSLKLPILVFKEDGINGLIQDTIEQNKQALVFVSSRRNARGSLSHIMDRRVVSERRGA